MQSPATYIIPASSPKNIIWLFTASGYVRLLQIDAKGPVLGTRFVFLWVSFQTAGVCITNVLSSPSGLCFWRRNRPYRKVTRPACSGSIATQLCCRFISYQSIRTLLWQLEWKFMGPILLGPGVTVNSLRYLTEKDTKLYLSSLSWFIFLWKGQI